jgi:synaptosomal-associated protein 47
MSSDICVHSWPCSYYLDLEKRWVPGKLSLMPHSLKFNTDRAGEALVGLPLSSITEIKKETSHFIFSAITILEKGHLKHWFSSLRPSRNVVFNVIEHFWRELLLSQPGATADATSSTMTRGKELTVLMARSQRRLEDTAKVLNHQGEQLDSVMRGLEKMESDLDVADRWVKPEAYSASPRSMDCPLHDSIFNTCLASCGKAVHLLCTLCRAHHKEPHVSLSLPLVLLVHRGAVRRVSL